MQPGLNVRRHSDISIDFDFYRRRAVRYRRRVMQMLLMRLLSRAGSLFDTWIGSCYRLYISTWRSLEIRDQRRQLCAMPNDLLRDIGINRTEIESIAIALVDAEFDPTRRPRGWSYPDRRKAR
jgi:uncharacterized protein YjiS (DUF1127 family)